MIKCVCGNKDCPVYLQIDRRTHVIELINGKKVYSTIYLDANTTVQLINELRIILPEFNKP